MNQRNNEVFVVFRDKSLDNETVLDVSNIQVTDGLVKMYREDGSMIWYAVDVIQRMSYYHADEKVS